MIILVYITLQLSYTDNKLISATLRVKNCSESKSTHICVEFQFLKGLPECSAPLTPNIPRKNYPFELNIDKSDECFRHSLLDESDQSKCCVSCDGNHYCRSADYNNNDGQYTCNIILKRN